MKKRVGSIDFLKFVFAIIIVMYHGTAFFPEGSRPLCLSGYIAVEFYFIVSGYLLTASSENYDGYGLFDADFGMIRRKILHLFPYIFIAAIFSNIWNAVGQLSATDISYNMLYSAGDILGLQMLGFPLFAATGVAWYISALLFVSFLIFPLLCKNRKLFARYIGPITALVIFGYLAQTTGTINDPGTWLGFVYKGLLRGYADISIGCTAYEMKLYIDIDGANHRAVYGFLEVTGFAVALFYGIFHETSDSHDFFIIPLLMISIAISFSKTSVLNKIFDHRIFNTLGLFSLSIFLDHFFIRSNLQRLFPSLSVTLMVMLYISSVTIFSIANYFIAGRLKKYLSSLKRVVVIMLLFLGVAEGLLLYGTISTNL